MWRSSCDVHFGGGLLAQESECVLALSVSKLSSNVLLQIRPKYESKTLSCSSINCIRRAHAASRPYPRVLRVPTP